MHQAENLPRLRRAVVDQNHREFWMPKTEPRKFPLLETILEYVDAVSLYGATPGFQRGLGGRLPPNLIDRYIQ
jgi:hypothetical protein